MRKFVLAALASALFSVAVVSYSSWYQIENLLWLRALIYLDDNKENPCSEQHQGYGRLYKHGCYVNPVSVVQSVGNVIDRVHQGASVTVEEKNSLLRAAAFLSEWAEKRSGSEGEYLIASYKFSWDEYGLAPGWVSGMAQGHAIEALVAAFEVTGNRAYLQTAEQFANAFYVPVEEGGVTVWTEEGPWFEEYAQSGKEPSFALNGHIFAIEGLYRLSQYSQEYKKLVYQAVETTKNRIDQYNTGWWSRYDLRGTIANQKYHHIHIRQLHWLGIEFGSKELDRVGQKFSLYQLYPFSSFLRFLTNPTRFLGFLLVINFTIIFSSIYLSVIFFNRLMARLNFG